MSLISDFNPNCHYHIDCDFRQNFLYSTRIDRHPVTEQTKI